MIDNFHPTRSVDGMRGVEHHERGVQAAAGILHKKAS